MRRPFLLATHAAGRYRRGDRRLIGLVVLVAVGDSSRSRKRTSKPAAAAGRGRQRRSRRPRRRAAPCAGRAAGRSAAQPGRRVLAPCRARPASRSAERQQRATAAGRAARSKCCSMMSRRRPQRRPLAEPLRPRNRDPRKPQPARRGRDSRQAAGAAIGHAAQARDAWPSGPTSARRARTAVIAEQASQLGPADHRRRSAIRRAAQGEVRPLGGHAGRQHGVDDRARAGADANRRPRKSPPCWPIPTACGRRSCSTKSFAGRATAGNRSGEYCMPLYEYACEDCGQQSELLVSSSTRADLPAMRQPRS